jgi:hypothetical protein
VGTSVGGISVGLGGVSGSGGSGGWGPSGRGTGGISGNMYVPQRDQVQMLRGPALTRRENLPMKYVSQARFESSRRSSADSTGRVAVIG